MSSSSVPSRATIDDVLGARWTRTITFCRAEAGLAVGRADLVTTTSMPTPDGGTLERLSRPARPACILNRRLFRSATPGLPPTTNPGPAEPPQTTRPFDTPTATGRLVSTDQPDLGLPRKLLDPRSVGTDSRRARFRRMLPGDGDASLLQSSTTRSATRLVAVDPAHAAALKRLRGSSSSEGLYIDFSWAFVVLRVGDGATRFGHGQISIPDGFFCLRCRSASSISFTSRPTSVGW